MVDLKGMGPAELQHIFLSWGERPFRASQLMKWIYKRRVEEFSLMTDLSKELRKKLAGLARISRLRPNQRLVSEDESRKYLFSLEDGEVVESVFIPEGRRRTVCLSSQVGCPLGCRFCLTGRMGFVRDLTPGEIINQFLAVLDDVGQDRLTNVVFMGMGEPLLNLEAVLKCVEVLTHPWGMGLGHRRITVSTVGIPAKIRTLAGLSKVNLAVSLHATRDELRKKLIPAAGKYPLAEVLAACRDYPVTERRRITFEYVLIAGVNDSPEEARRLANLLAGISCKINLIPFNEYPGSPFKAPAEAAVVSFQRVLIESQLTCLLRKSRGADIMAACGQLGFSQGFRAGKMARV
ncbi:MAG: 23S rRNA (adenine(2503)-C(2))-methyltransferase RlmN [Thermodesulfobacteriota bacterium]